MACASITGRDAQSNLMAPYYEKEAAMRCFFSLDSPAPQRGERSALTSYCTAGRLDRLEGVGLLRQVGWPKPPALIPVPPFGLDVMSKMMLSG
jgi:hypothetical protein